MTIDTNILIAYLGGDLAVQKVLSRWRQENKPLFLSAIVEAEILSFADWTESDYRFAEKFLEENFAFISFDRMTARIAAHLRRTLKIKLPDAIIAATAIFTHTPVVTRNYKDFEKIKELRIIVI